MSAQDYKLNYFDSRGLAEPIRLMLILAGIKYEDHRFDATDKIERNGKNLAREFWDLRDKQALPYGQVPILEVGSGDSKVVLSQHLAIVRYIARECGYFGKTNLEGALIDSVIEHMRDLLTKFQGSSTAEDKAKIVSDYLPGHVAHVNRFIEVHSTSADKSTCVGSSMSLADVIVYYFYSYFMSPAVSQNLTAEAHHVQAVCDAVANHPLIKAWIEIRPVTAV